jgi:chromosome segregation ATPase
MISIAIIVLLSLIGLLLALIAYRERENGKVIESLKIQNNTLNDTILEFSKRITSVKTQISNLEYVNNQLEKDLETSHQLLHNHLEEIDWVRKNSERHQESAIQLIDTLQSINKGLADEIRERNKEIESMRIEIEQRAKNEEQRMEELQNENKKSQRRIRELEDQLTIKNHNIETLTAEFKRVINENQDQQRQLKENQAELERLRENLNRMTEELRWFKMLTRSQLKKLAMPEKKIEEFIETVEYEVRNQIENGMEKIVSACL